MKAINVRPSQISILLSGGYYNGRTSMAYPLTEYLSRRESGLIGSSHRSRGSVLTDRWDYVGSLSEERQWGPCLGLVAGIPVIATGKNYGDGTIEQLENSGPVSDVTHELGLSLV